MSESSTSKKAAVIGSGFGELGAATPPKWSIKQCCKGSDLPGGRAYVYQDDGFTFDAGPTVITAPYSNRFV